MQTQHTSEAPSQSHTADLWRAFRVMVRAGTDPVRQTLFEELMSRKVAVRAAVTIHRLLGRGWLSTLFVSMYVLRA